VKRLMLVVTVVALIAALMAPTAQAQQQGHWDWCWNSWSWSWDSCWLDGVDQTSGQDVTSGIATQTIHVGPHL
jgi:hypothetical protein